MITVTINRKKSGFIQSFTVSGHAFYDNPGKDIVCAGVSAVSVGAINAVHEITGILPDVEQGGNNGFLKCILPEDIPESVQDKVQILLEGMVVSLQTIEEQYGEYIKITFKK